MKTLPTVTLDNLAGRQGDAWDVLLDLSPTLGQDWTVIGGQMVMLHQAERQPNQMPSVVRLSHDIDVVVNIRAGPTPATIIDTALRDSGFAQMPSDIGHRYVRDSDGVVFDVLAPDNLGKNSPRLGKGRTIGTPGGTQALKRTSWIIAIRGPRKAMIPRPNIIGALLIKVAAATGPASARGSERHYEDIAILAALLRDDDFQTASLTRNERRLIRRAVELMTPKIGILHGEGAVKRLRLLSGNSPDSSQPASEPAISNASCGHWTPTGPCKNPKPPPGGRCAGKHQH